MALNTLIKLADDLDKDGKAEYVQNIEKVIDKLCKGEREQVVNYLIKAADFFDNNKMNRYAESVDMIIQKLASDELDAKKKRMEDKIVFLRNTLELTPEGPEKEKIRNELRTMESGFNNMQQALNALKPGTEMALETDKDRVRNMFKPEKARARLQPVAPDYMVDKENFVAPLRNVFKIRRLIRQIAVGTDFLPTKYGRTIKDSGPFSWPIFWIIYSLRNKLNLPKGWQTAFDKRNKYLEEADADAMRVHIEDALGNLLREAQMPQSMRDIVREREAPRRV